MTKILTAVACVAILGVATAPMELFGAAGDELQCHNLIEPVFCGLYQNPMNCVEINGQQYCETIGAWRAALPGEQ